MSSYFYEVFSSYKQIYKTVTPDFSKKTPQKQQSSTREKKKDTSLKVQIKN